MKRTCALLMSLVLLVAQFAFAAPTCLAGSAASSKTAKHACCPPAKLACNAACCVANDSAPRGPMTPAPAPTTDHGPRLTPLALLFALWTLPAPADLSASFSAPSSGTVPAPAVPLFLRHGTLLI